MVPAEVDDEPVETASRAQANVSGEKAFARAAAVPQQAMPQNIRQGRKALVIDCLLGLIVGPGDGRAFHIARSMPGFRNPSSRCFHCISHNAAGKEIRDSGFPENIRPAIRTDALFHRMNQCCTARLASTPVCA